MIRSIRYSLLGVFAVTIAAIENAPAQSRAAPTPPFRPPAASIRPLDDLVGTQAPDGRSQLAEDVLGPNAVVQKGGRGGGGRGPGPGIGGGRGPGPGFGRGPGVRIGGPGIRIGVGPARFGVGIGVAVPLRGGIGGYPFYPYSVYPSYSSPLIGSPELLPAPSAETGLRIQDLYEGAARQAALRQGDIIVAVGNARVRTFNELAQTLASVKGPVEVTYLAGGTGKTEKAIVTPVDGKIGVGVVPVDLQ